ncbi:hypothetical protein WP50_09355, partial [Lactiplantibacillus plantarum]
GQFKLSDNGGVAFDQIVNHYMGNAGQAILAVLIITTCLTTAIGLVAAFAQVLSGSDELDVSCCWLLPLLSRSIASGRPLAVLFKVIRRKAVTKLRW